MTDNTRADSKKKDKKKDKKTNEKKKEKPKKEESYSELRTKLDELLKDGGDNHKLILKITHKCMLDHTFLI